MTSAYHRPHSLPEALALLAAQPCTVLAGGTDLYATGQALPPAQPLLDVTGIAALQGIQATAEGWRFGATATWSDVLAAPLPPAFTALKQAAREVGGVQVQNMGTVAGNLCNASPAADGTPVWLALQADVLLAGPRGKRRLPVAEFVTGVRRTARAADEIVTALLVPTPRPSRRSAFGKLGGRRYLVISTTMAAVVLDVDAHGRISHVAVAVGSCSAVAQRLPQLEARLLGHPLPQANALAITPADLAPLQPLDDIRGSAAYRLQASAELLRRLLHEAAGTASPLATP